VATTRFDERLLASLGLLEAAPIRFEPVTDVPNGGVLCALPALLAFGLLEHTPKKFSLPAGFYPLPAIFLLIAFLALARVKSIEAARYEPPGEWGKLIGLDRIPEVRTLRQKIDLLCQDGETVREWSGVLAQEWMKVNPQTAGCLYVDGHVRVYHGSLTPLPKRYVSRQRLCLRGTTDYWVNAMDGQPFFVVTQAVDPGLRKVLEEQIVPRLLGEVPGQPTQEQLDADRLLARWTLIFDREGYSPELFARLWQDRVAVITYRKFTDEQDYWREEEFRLHTVKLVNGEQVQLWLAERGVRLSNGLWVREIRRRDEQTGHQTAILTTDFRRALEPVAAAMFARWCQENFFRYMGEHYGLNRLIEYGTEPVPDTTLVSNPALKRKTQEVRRQRAQLLKEKAQFEALTAPAQPEALAQFELEKGQWLERIQQRQQTLKLLKAERKALPKRIPFKELPAEERFAQLRTSKKHFVDTIKMIAYRAETALVHMAREHLERPDDARALVRQVLTSTVDLLPDLANQILKVRLHPLATAAHNEVLRHLCAELTDTETEYPGTQQRMVFELIGANEIP
jgi:hypothetical protein